MQISERAFRYFKNRNASFTGKPIVSFRKRIIKDAVPYKVNRASYLKPGSAIAKSKKEDKFFDNMFEITLKDDYENAYEFRDQDRAKKDLEHIQ